MKMIRMWKKYIPDRVQSQYKIWGIGNNWEIILQIFSFAASGGFPFVEKKLEANFFT